MHNAGARDGANGLIFIREVSGYCFGRAVSCLRIAADKAERLISCRESFGELVADGASGSEDRDHSILLLNAQNVESRVRPPSRSCTALKSGGPYASDDRQRDMAKLWELYAFKFTRINIELTILRKEIEDFRQEPPANGRGLLGSERGDGNCGASHDPRR